MENIPYNVFNAEFNKYSNLLLYNYLVKNKGKTRIKTNNMYQAIYEPKANINNSIVRSDIPGFIHGKY